MFQARTGELPADVEVELITRLFNALPQILCVTTGLMAGSAFMLYQTGDGWMGVILALAIVTSAARIVGIFAFRRLRPPKLTLELARAWERAYSIPAILFTIVMSMLTMRVFAGGWTDGQILAVGLVMALTAGTCARTLRYWICATLSTIALGTLMTMLLVSGEPVKIGIAMLFGLYLWSVYESSKHIVSQVEALLIAERELDAAARRDPLTGLPNRRQFGDAVAAADEVGFALLALDLDGFKGVNDRFGHVAGDELLRQVAERLSGVVRKGDTLVRLGGDEFSIVLPGTDPVDAKAVADRAVAAVGMPYIVLGAPVIVGVSCGIEIVPAGKASDLESIMAAADVALYAAKAAGKGRAVIGKAA